ncbi:hypothetical protein FRC14_000867 [Serendipita sp. 396]|nr:hypothetical protein FRC14_000867 [Serendipita sp. 396]
MEWLHRGIWRDVCVIAIGYFLDMVKEMAPLVVKLRLPSLYEHKLQSKLMDLPSLRHLTLDDCTEELGRIAWYRSMIGNLTSLTMWNHYTRMPQSLLYNEYLQGAGSLRVLELQGLWSIDQLYPALFELRSLEHVRMTLCSMSIRGWQFIHHRPEAPNFSKLKCLEITLRPFTSDNLPKSVRLSLFYFIQSLLAEVKYLETIRVSTLKLENQFNFGEALASFLVKKFRHSLRVLCLDSMRLPNETISRICQQCPNLEELGLVYPYPYPELDLATLCAAFKLRPMLKTLLLTTTTASDSVIRVMLSQTSTHLIRIYLRTSGPSFSIWEVQWSYDSELLLPRRHICSRIVSDKEWNAEVYGTE